MYKDESEKVQGVRDLPGFPLWCADHKTSFLSPCFPPVLCVTALSSVDAVYYVDERKDLRLLKDKERMPYPCETLETR